MASFLFNGTPIPFEDGETVLEALIGNNVTVGHGCKAGACQSCILQTSGSVPEAAQVGLDESLVEQGAFLSCQARARDITSAESIGAGQVQRFVGKLVESRWANPDVLIATFRVPGWRADPGRFVRVHHPTGVWRPYSLAAAAWEDPDLIQIHVRILPGGAMSELLATATGGDTFEFEGPLGQCKYRSITSTEKMLLIGSGTGLAPLYGIATDALIKGHIGSIHLYQGGATSGHLYFRKELESLAKCHPTFSYTLCADAVQTNTDRVGTPLAAALAEHPQMEGYRVYLCGHPALVKAAQRKCFLAGASLKDIAADAFMDSSGGSIPGLAASKS